MHAPSVNSPSRKSENLPVLCRDVVCPEDLHSYVKSSQLEVISSSAAPPPPPLNLVLQGNSVTGPEEGAWPSCTRKVWVGWEAQVTVADIHLNVNVLWAQVQNLTLKDLFPNVWPLRRKLQPSRSKEGLLPVMLYSSSPLCLLPPLTPGSCSVPLLWRPPIGPVLRSPKPQIAQHHIQFGNSCLGGPTQ